MDIITTMESVCFVLDISYEEESTLINSNCRFLPGTTLLQTYVNYIVYLVIVLTFTLSLSFSIFDVLVSF